MTPKELLSKCEKFAKAINLDVKFELNNTDNFCDPTINVYGMNLCLEIYENEYIVSEIVNVNNGWDTPPSEEYKALFVNKNIYTVLIEFFGYITKYQLQEIISNENEENNK